MSAVRKEPRREDLRRTSRSVLAVIVLVFLYSAAAPLAAHGPLEAALADLDRRLLTAPGSVGGHIVRAELRRAAGDWRGALTDLDAAASLDPSRPEIPLYRGRSLLDAGRPRLAEVAFTRALALLSAGGASVGEVGASTTLALTQRAEARRRLGLLKAAADDLGLAIGGLERPSAELLLQRARLLGARGELSEALAMLEMGLGLYGPVPPIVREAVRIELARGEEEKAIARLDALTDDSDRRDRWLGERGDLLFEVGREDEARRAWGEALGEIELLPPWRRSTPASRRLRARLSTLSAPTSPGRRPTVGAPERPSLHRSSARASRRRAPVLRGLGAEVVRGPYLQRLTPGSVTVRWRTDVAVGTRLDLGPEPADLVTVVDDPTPVTDHEAVVGGLAAASSWVYAVGAEGSILAGGDEDHRFNTAPAAGADVPVRLWVLGDSGTGGSGPAAVRDAFDAFSAGRPPDLWIMLGDNAYPAGTDAEYQRAVFDLFGPTLRRAPLWPTVGNHDALSADSPSQTGAYFDAFTLPSAGEAGGLPSGTEAYYAFDWGPIHLVCLDSSDTPLGADDAMAYWLEADLASTLQRWLVVFFHHPPYSKGSHDSDNAADSGGRLTAMREVFLPILEDHGVDLVLSGHSHAYERSMLLAGHFGTSETLTGSMIVDPGDGDPAGDGAYLKTDRGSLYAVAGSSALVGGGSLDHPVMVGSIPSLGSLVLDVDGAVLTGRFLDDTGTVLDTFELRKALPIFDDGFESGGVGEWSSSEG